MMLTTKMRFYSQLWEKQSLAKYLWHVIIEWWLPTATYDHLQPAICRRHLLATTCNIFKIDLKDRCDNCQWLQLLPITIRHVIDCSSLATDFRTFFLSFFFGFPMGRSACFGDSFGVCCFGVWTEDDASVLEVVVGVSRERWSILGRFGKGLMS